MEEININDFNKILEKIKMLSQEFFNAEQQDAETNIFAILKLEEFELRHSAFLAWLLKQPRFRQAFLKTCGLNNDKVSALMADEPIVDTEYTKDLGDLRADIVVNFTKTKFLILIENKFNAKESENQLSEYFKKISQNFRNYGQNNLKFIFLTRNGIQPKNQDDKKNWQCLSYAQILYTLEKIKQEPKSANDLANIFIKQYITLLKKKTEGTMDRIEEYRKLYTKNWKLMSEMASYIPNINQRAKIIRQYLDNTPQFKRISSDRSNVYIDFADDKLCQVLLAHNKPDNWLFFKISNNDFNIAIELRIKKINDYETFRQQFLNEFKRPDRSKHGDECVLYRQNLITSEKPNYLTEDEIQERIAINLNEFFVENSETYHKILKFITNYHY